MSDHAIGASAGAPSPIRARTMLIVLAVGIVSFAAMLVLGAYAPDLRSGRNGGAHALSNAATGFSGLVTLAEATDHNPVVVRTEQMLDSEDLAVLSPEKAATNLNKVLALRETRPTLIILPKWKTSASADHRGWVTSSGPVATSEPQGVLAPEWPTVVQRQRGEGPLLTVAPAATGIQFTAPRLLQTISGKRLTPLITDAQGHIVLARLGDRPLFLLADPDLLSNRAMADPQQVEQVCAVT